jgi:hypothetical protein
MADRVDAAVNRMQQPASDTVLDRAAPEPELRQLRSRDDATLGARERGDRLIRSRVRFDIYSMANRTRDGHAPIVARYASRIYT